LAAALELDDPWELFYARFGLLGAFGQSDPSRAVAEGEENLRRARQLANPSMLVYATMLLAPHIAQSDPTRAEALLEEAIGIADATKNDFAGIMARTHLGSVRALRGDHLGAAGAYLSAAERANRVGDRPSVFGAIGAVACDLAELGDHDPALLLATWAGRRGHWTEDRPIYFPDSPTLTARRAAISPAQRQQLDDRAEALDDAEAIALARAQVDRLRRE
jgi:hypothetical protein